MERNGRKDSDGTLDAGRLAVRVYYEDTDFSGLVYHASYLRFLERGRTEWLRGLGFEQRRLEQADALTFAVHRLEIDYLRPARMDDELIVLTRVRRLGGASIDFRQTICLLYTSPSPRDS